MPHLQEGSNLDGESKESPTLSSVCVCEWLYNRSNEETALAAGRRTISSSLCACLLDAERELIFPTSLSPLLPLVSHKRNHFHGELFLHTYPYLSALMANLLHVYQEEIQSQLLQAENNAQSKSLEGFQKAEGAIAAAKDNLDSLRAVVCGLPEDERCGAEQTVFFYVKELRRVEALLLSQKQKLLLTGPTAEGADARELRHAEAERRGADRVTETLKSGTTTLSKAEGLLHRTNAVGGEALTSLRGQTEQLNALGDRVNDVDAEVSQAMTVMRDMRRTALKHKMLLYGVLSFVVFIFICIVYVKFR